MNRNRTLKGELSNKRTFTHKATFMYNLLNMKFTWLWVFSLVIVCQSSPITVQLQKNGKECVYIDVDDSDCKISYYFAVQEGENNAFRVSYELWSPDDTEYPMIYKDDEEQGQWTFPAKHTGEYALCVIGDEYPKIVDLDIVQICFDQIPKPADPRLIGETIDSSLVRTLQDSVNIIEDQLQVLERNLKLYKSRAERNHHTVKSIASRLVTISICSIVLVPTIAVLEIIIMKYILGKFKS
ncbi:Erp3p [Kluyveromyces lactis]|uniref:KLLA0C04323p n=1 Tax=Kluyveromyces lactis (strain ATCC 8585 / CBS 2359 / DSM 70799 / NBRC 1267 / NRRL Y-1140 / WM37) TaxID=284590 RepID=Q6CUJ9_KLULA|nr:uncharacterized protein KLLA0_C04323g [Kluyveromyces lactis]CAH01241.1 KLLA0C04323p [Kluyveromyces lactis]|eukprot:XP_452390.1 uncharacterized protein KLLA0_C04323g [Kluyveromyces lactis]